MVFFFKQKTAYEIASCLVGSEMCIRDRILVVKGNAALSDVQGFSIYLYRHLSRDIDFFRRNSFLQACV